MRLDGARAFGSEVTLCFGVVACVLFSNPARGDEFIRGDANTDGLVEISDIAFTLTHLFQGGAASCRDAMDANDDGVVDLSDAVHGLTYLFGMGDPPPAPASWCGVDPTPDGLDCARNVTCSLGGPIEGLTVEELRAYRRGRIVAERRFRPSDGLGPLFNATSCVSCHNTPALGGSAALYRNVFLVAIGPPGAQLPPPGLPSLEFPLYAGFDAPRPRFPESFPGFPVTIAQRNAPPLFGVGLFEFVSNPEIASRADPNDLLVPDGITGRFNTDGLGLVGRFGVKANVNFLEGFIRFALRDHMGITTDPVDGLGGTVSLALHKQPGGIPYDLPMTDDDGVADPELTVTDLADLIVFIRFMAPPKPAPFGPSEVAGEELFSQIGCGDCHVPEIASSRGPLRAYTDLLLHDLGPQLADGISRGAPQISVADPFNTAHEFRTTPLWGVSRSGPWLHDGRADRLEDAILLHGGEGQASADAFEALGPVERQQVLSFLEAL